jgi:hypothetical protein
MKYLIITTFVFFATFLQAQVEVTYHLSYDFGTETYTVSMTSNTSYTNPLSRITGSTQVTIVIPQIMGGWQVDNLTALTALGWGFSYLDGTTESLSDDYLFFAPTNAGTYTPFNINAGVPIPLFSFQSGSGCVGNLALYENGSDPLDDVPSINGGNNIVILGAGSGNKWVGNTSGPASCSLPCEADAGTLSY